MTQRLDLVVVCGSTRSPSRTLALAEALAQAVAARTAVTTHLVRLSDIARELGQALSRDEVPVHVDRQLRRIETADALIVATPVHRGGLPGHFKHLFDLIAGDALTDKPVLLAATGGSARHTLVIEHQLRPLFGFLQAMTLPVGVYADSDDFVERHAAGVKLKERIALAADRAAPVLARLAPSSVARVAA